MYLIFWGMELPGKSGGSRLKYIPILYYIRFSKFVKYFN